MPKIIDLTGEVFGELTVLEKDFSRKGKNSYWKCLCNCGNETSVMASNLRSGQTTSCGCKKRRTNLNRIKDLTGKIFNELTVIELDNTYREEKNLNKNRTYWKVQCSCGNIFTTCGHNLQRGMISCGCKNSKAEYLIIQQLNNLKIKYKTQYNTPQMKLSSGKSPRFDFALLDSNEKVVCLIEYNGKQHYSFSGTGWDTEEHLKQTQQRDLEKKQICKNLNIPLEIISYKEEYKLDKIIQEICLKYNLL